MAAARRRFVDKRDRLRQLRAFCHAARLRSFTLGGERLGLSQPAVSLHVRELQHELGAVLFERDGQQLSLTRAGEMLYEIAMPLVQAMDGMHHALAEEGDEIDTGELHIAAADSATTFVLPPYLERFRDRYPGFVLDLRCVATDEGLALLSAGEVEFLIAAREPGTDGFDYHSIFAYDLVLIVPCGHPLAGRESVDLGEAAAWPAIVPPRGAYSRQLGESIGHRFAAAATVAVEVAGWDVIKECVAAGLGVAVVPGHCIVEGDPLVAIPFAEDAPAHSYGVFTLARPHDRPLSPPAERFIRLVAPDFPHERA